MRLTPDDWDRCVSALKIAARHYRRRARKAEELAERMANARLDDEGRRTTPQQEG